MSRITMFALAAAISTPFVSTQQPPTPQDSRKQDSSKAAMTDSDFLMKVHDSGMKEVEIAKMAAEKSSNADVKAYARRLVTDHSAANDELMKLSRSKNVTLRSAADPVKSDQPTPTKSDPATTHAPIEHLKTLTGTAFDRAFVDQMVKDHKQAVDLFEARAADSKDEEVKSWAEKKVPTLKEHLKMAKDLQEKVAR